MGGGLGRRPGRLRDFPAVSRQTAGMRWLPLLCLLAACGAPRPSPLDAARAGWLATHTRPVIEVEPGRLLVWRAADHPETIQLDTPDTLTVARAVGLPIELHRRLLARARPVLTAEEAEALARWRHQLAAEAPTAQGPETKARLGRMQAQSVALLEGAARTGALEREAVVAQLRGLAPVTEQLAVDLAALRLVALHRAVQQVWAGLAPEERVLLRVVVRDTASARAGHWASQYFERVLGLEGEGPRLLYSEAPAATLDDRVLDEATGRDVFEDPERLRRDLLAEGARAWLDQVGPLLAPTAFTPPPTH